LEEGAVRDYEQRKARIKEILEDIVKCIKPPTKKKQVICVHNAGLE
jgi:hypothetical protein